MKKQFIVTATVCLLFAAATGCTKPPSGSQEQLPPPSAPMQSEQPAQPSEPPKEQQEQPVTTEQSIIVVADAALYRGTVTEITTAENGIVITLVQPQGINFGAPTVKFYVQESTRLSFTREALVPGEYVEVFYGHDPQAAIGKVTHEAIAINKYLKETAVNFNGTVMEFKQDSQKNGSGTLLMKELETNRVVNFIFDDATNFYLNADALKAGDKLNIFHRGSYALSEPPQGYALEIRQYYESNYPSSTGAVL